MGAHPWQMVAAVMAVVVVICSKRNRKNNNQLRTLPHNDSAKNDGGKHHKYTQGHDQ
jgi:hypothetical protein